MQFETIRYETDADHVATITLILGKDMVRSR